MAKANYKLMITVTSMIISIMMIKDLQGGLAPAIEVPHLFSF